MKKCAAILVLTLFSVGRIWASKETGAPNSLVQNNPPTLTDQVIKLLQAHTAPAVVQAFVLGWSAPYLTRVEDLLRLRAAGADEALLKAYSKRGAELRFKAHQQSQARAQGQTNAPATILIYSAPRLGGNGATLLEPPTRYYFSESLWWWGEFYRPEWWGVPYRWPYQW